MLEQITLRFPGTHPEFHSRLLSLLAGLGKTSPRAVEPAVSDEKYLPRLFLEFSAGDADPSAIFRLSGGELPVRIENTAGAEKKNPLPYRPLSIDDAIQRFDTAGWKILHLDHVGFNLPWFGPDVHPRIRDLRARLAGACLYHKYPSGEPWDFILPGEGEEILGRKRVDYSVTRRPKFELVSFAVASTPLIQIDLCLNARFEDLKARFPEALVDPALRNIWIYLENPYPIDVCLVANEPSDGDWCGYFEGCRL